MNEQRNLLLAIIVSVAILFGFQMAFAPQEPLVENQDSASIDNVPSRGDVQRPVSGQTDASVPVETGDGRAVILGQDPRIFINPDNPAVNVSGSIALKGGRIDDVVLNRYQQTVEPRSPNIVLLSPTGTTHPYYAEFGG